MSREVCDQEVDDIHKRDEYKTACSVLRALDDPKSKLNLDSLSKKRLSRHISIRIHRYQGGGKYGHINTSRVIAALNHPDNIYSIFDHEKPQIAKHITNFVLSEREQSNERLRSSGHKSI